MLKALKQIIKFGGYKMNSNRRKFLQNAAFLTAALFLFISGNVFAANTELIENINAVCLAPSQAGKYWNVTVKGDIKADGSVKLIAAGVKGEAIFTKGEWQGVQQVLKERQPDDNDSFRKCSMTLTPLFLEKFAPKKPATENKIENSTVSGTVNQAGGNINIGTGK